MATAMESSSSGSSFSDDEAVLDCDLPTMLHNRDVRPYMFEPPAHENTNRRKMPPDSPPRPSHAGNTCYLLVNKLLTAQILSTIAYIL